MLEWLFVIILFLVGGVYYWVWGTKIFSLQSRTLFGRETEYTKQTLASGFGRFTVSRLPALMFFAAALVTAIAGLLAWANQR